MLFRSQAHQRHHRVQIVGRQVQHRQVVPDRIVEIDADHIVGNYMWKPEDCAGEGTEVSRDRTGNLVLRVTRVGLCQQQADGSVPELQFAQNPDILATVAARTNLAGFPYCVGFAAESENLLAFGAAKREKKGIPLLVGNIGHHTFGQDDNTIILFDENGHTILPRADKLTLARQLISEISKRIAKHSLFK